MEKPYSGRIVLIDDDSSIVSFWTLALENSGFRVSSGTSLRDLEELIPRFSFDLAILDLNLGEESGIDGIVAVRKKSPLTKVLMLSNCSELESVVQTIKMGADDYVTKDSSIPEVISKIEGLLVPTLHNEPENPENLAQFGFIGNSKMYHSTCKTLLKIKDVDSTVLILGESGSGKEVVARCLHKLSKRKNGRFEAINCAAIPEALLESELFGHKKGAFTDAKADRKGIFELCSSGTLLLDEIGDLPLSLQAKLLRVLQEKEVVPVGSSTPIKIETRILAATHRNLQQEVEEGRFREDLYYRLSVVPIKIPPLRQRKKDIELLTSFFISEIGKKFDIEVNELSPEVFSRIKNYDWPGNIRELRNSIERAVVLAEDGNISIDDLFQHLSGKSSKPGNSTSKSDPIESPTKLGSRFTELELTEARQLFEKVYIENLLVEHSGNVANVAKQSGRYRTDIYRLMSKYGIKSETFR